MNTQNQFTVAGVFKDYGSAEAVAQELKDAGYADKNIHITNDRETGTYGGQRVSHEEGGVGGFFRRLFGSDDDSRDYEREVSNGRPVVSVETSQDNMDRATEIMNRWGAINIERDGQSGTERKPSAGRTEQATGGRSIPVVEEELQVGKRAVNRGGVRVYSRVVDQPVEEKVTLREEHVNVERRPVDRPVTAADEANLRDQTIEVLETAEEPVVSKRAHVVEEIAVNKETTERTETVRDNVRRTEVNVDNVNDRNRTAAPAVDDNEFRRDFEARYASRGDQYDKYAPAYRYGYTAASDARYRGRSWSDAEADLQRDYVRDYPDSAWEDVRGAARYGWEKVTGRLSHA